MRTWWFAIPLLAGVPLFYGGMGEAGHAVTAASGIFFAVVLIFRCGLFEVLQRLAPFRYLFGSLLLLAAVQLVPLPSGLLAGLSSHTVSLARSAARTQAGRQIRLSTLAGDQVSDSLLIPASEASDWRDESRNRGATWHALALLPGTADRAFVKLIFFLLLAGAFACATVSRRQARRLISLVAVGASATALGNIFKLSIPSLGLGPFPNRDHLASFCLAALPLVVSLLPRRIGTRDDEKKHQRNVAILILLALPLSLLATATLVSGSRTGITLLPLVLAASFLAWSGRVRWRATVGIVLVSMVAATALYIEGGRFTRGFRQLHDGKSLGYRLGLYETALSGWRLVPLFGAGLGCAPALIETLDPDPRRFVNYVHNDYLQWLSETGLLGALLVIPAILALARRRVQRERSLAVVSLCALGLHALVDSPLRTNAVAVTACLVLGLLMSPRRRDKSPASRQIRVSSPPRCS